VPSSPHVSDDLPRLSYGLGEITIVTGIPRSSLFVFLANGELDSYKVGRRRYVTAAELQRFLEQHGARFSSERSTSPAPTPTRAVATAKRKTHNS
jgi:hypothetical protein